MTIDLAGHRFGRLAVTHVARGGKSGRQRGWSCTCDCGRVVWRTASNLNATLKRGGSSDCRGGDEGRSCRSDITGRTFGRLTVIGPIEGQRAPDGHRMYECACICGKSAIINCAKLANGHTRSCGCARSGWKNIARRKPPGFAAQNAVVHMYRQNARAKNVDYTLTREQAIELFTSRCWYCGAEPSRTMQTKHMYSGFVYNGIDRMDNDRGYVADNVVPCCTECNFKKGKQSYVEFVRWVRTVAAHVRDR